MFFEEKYTPRMADFDRRGRMSLSSLLCIIEDIGGHHSHAAGDDVYSNLREGVAWINAQWRVRITALPGMFDSVTVTTWARELTNPVSVLRDYTVADGKGDILVRAEAKFALIEAKTGRIMRIGPDRYEPYGPETKALFDTPMPRLRPPADMGEAVPVALRRADMDFNGHVHNTRYLDLAAQAMPEDAFENVTGIDIAYRRSLTEGENAAVAVKDVPEGRFAVIYGGDGPSCFIRLLEGEDRP